MRLLVHKISDNIRIEESVRIEPTRTRVYINKVEQPMPGKEHVLKLFYNDQFVCKVSFCCSDDDVDKYRPGYIDELLNKLPNEVKEHIPA